MATFRYTKTHEYIREEGGKYFLGITDHAQKELGDITYVEQPGEGAEFAQGDVCCTIESVKAVAEVYSPLALSVVSVNPRLEGEPELLNKDPEGEGWIIEIKPADAAALGQLLDQAAYDALAK